MLCCLRDSLSGVVRSAELPTDRDRMLNRILERLRLRPDRLTEDEQRRLR